MGSGTVMNETTKVQHLSLQSKEAESSSSS